MKSARRSGCRSLWEAVAVGDLAFDTADRQVHAGHAPGGVVGLLAVDGDSGCCLGARESRSGAGVAVAVAGGVGLDELDGLDEHAGGAAAGVVDAAFVRLEHFDQEPDDAARGVELAAFSALGNGELFEEVFVNAAEDVSGAGLGAAHFDVAHHVDHLAEAGLVERGAGVVLGEHVPEGGVVALDGGHGVVDDRADGGLVGPGLQDRPAGVGRHPEDVLGDVLVAVLGGFCTPLGEHLCVALLEGVGNVLEEDEAEDDVLVLGGVHAAAEGVGHAPELGAVVEGLAGGGASGGHGVLSGSRWVSGSHGATGGLLDSTGSSGLVCALGMVG